MPVTGPVKRVGTAVGRGTRAVGRGVKHGSLWLYSVAAWSVVALGTGVLVVMLVARYLVLPSIGDHREAIAEHLSRAIGQRVTLGSVTGNWEGLHPYLVLNDVRVHDASGNLALALARVDSTLSWWSLYAWDLRFYALDIFQPDLTVQRDTDGGYRVGGIEIKPSAVEGSGFADWLLRQERVVVHEARVRWEDQQRNAPPLELTEVDIRLENDGDRHRFGVRAVPPAALAGRLDVRGDLTGERSADLAQWHGTLFVEVDYIDIPAWQQWVPFPVAFPHGTGALRLWANAEQGALRGLTADIALAGVRAQLNPEGEPLDLAGLKGRVAWRELGDGFEVSTQQLSIATHDGRGQQPLDLNFRVRGQSPQQQTGELRANVLDLEPLFALAANLPIPVDTRETFTAFAPAGTLYDVAVKWQGAWPQPREYSASARFADLTVLPVGRLPGFSGITGHLDGSEKGGNLLLTSQAGSVELPKVFRDPLQFDALTAQVAWARVGGASPADASGSSWAIRLNNVQFANADLAGEVTGVYQTAAEGPGIVDLEGRLTRADAARFSRYLPLHVAEQSRPWLEQAIIAGVSNDVRVTVKGDLREFPFPDSKHGQFRVAAKVAGGKLAYAENWPPLEEIDLDLLFIGNRMDAFARGASLAGIRLAKVRAEIPELNTAHGNVLKVSGEADGATADFLHLVAQSPIRDMIDRFSEGISADGRGLLSLEFDMPLDNPSATRLSGAYQVLNNRLVIEPTLPPLEQLNARLEFTETQVRLPSATFMLLGGPASASGSSDKNGIRIALQGRANVDNLRQQAATLPLVDTLRGAFDWRGTVLLRNRQADMTFESTLAGVSAAWPAPLGKSADEALPLRIERRVLSPQQDTLQVALGDVFAMQAVRRIDADGAKIERATVVFGAAVAPPPAPEQRGVWVTGAAKLLDADGWLSLLQPRNGSAGPTLQLAGLDVKVDLLKVIGKSFHNVALNLVQRADAWSGTISATELAGDVIWRAAERGQLTARLKRFDVPASPLPVAAPKPGSETTAAVAAYQPRELPALDIVADEVTFRDKALGRLEFMAVPDGRDWKIDKLRVTNPDGVLALEGLWQPSLSTPRTHLSTRLEVKDIGKFLARLGLPPAIKGGTARIEGPLSWNGVPYDIDYPSLSGTLIVESQKGQFIKLDPGFGKLLGVLSLQSIPRRLSLDFRDIFSEGLAYDDLISTVKINRGVAATESLRINGPSARIVMSGDIDIARETQNLRVRVTPFIGDSLAVAGALIGGPIAGVATYLVQKMLRDPINELASFEYRVTGTWNDPVVLKTGETSPKAAEGAPAEVPIPAGDAKNLQLPGR